MTIPPVALIVNANPFNSCETDNQIFIPLVQYGGSLNHRKPCYHKIRDVLRNQSNIEVKFLALYRYSFFSDV